jgi:hypothetical protein
VFVGYKTPTNTRLSGSAFFLGVVDRGEGFAYLVTAAHVLEGIAERGFDEVYVRLNATDGGVVDVRTDMKHWRFHPSDRSIDVAVIPWDDLSGLDRLCTPNPPCTPNRRAAHQIGKPDLATP